MSDLDEGTGRTKIKNKDKDKKLKIGKNCKILSVWLRFQYYKLGYNFGFGSDFGSVRVYSKNMCDDFKNLLACRILVYEEILHFMSFPYFESDITQKNVIF